MVFTLGFCAALRLSVKLLEPERTFFTANREGAKECTVAFFSKPSYSYLSLSTGLAFAAFSDFVLTTRTAINSTNSPGKVNSHHFNSM